MTYSWQFKNLRVAAQQGDLADVVVSVRYRIGYTADRSRWSYYYGSVEFGPADPNAFTDFYKISEATMIAFVENSLGDELQAIQTELKASYDNPVNEMPLPWNDVDTEEAD